MTILEKVFFRVLYSSLTATAVVLLILFLKKTLKDKFTPRFHHILWLLVLIRLLIPFAPKSSLSLFNILPNHNQNLSFNILIPKPKESQPLALKQVSTVNKIQPNFIDDTQQANYKNHLPQDDLAEPKNSTLKDKNTDIFPRNLKLLSYIWFIGVSLMTLFVLAAALRFREDAKSFDKTGCPNTIDILNNYKEKLKISKQIELFCGNDFKSPFIFGVLKPGIYLPRHILTKVDNEELSHIFLHELSHYKRGDLLCNLLSTVAVTLHWFNPIVWFAMKKMRSDIECACDSYVLENLEDSELVHYGMTIIKLSSLISKPDHNNMLYAHFYESKDQIERRINMINMFKKGSYKLSAIALIFFIALGTCTLTNANAQTDWNVVTKPTEPAESMKTEQFDFENPFKVFSTLDRAMDFIDFEFKVPDKKPSDYEFGTILLDEEKGLASVDFTKVNGDNQIGVSILASNNDMIKYLKEMHSDAHEKVINERTIKPDIKFSEEPMNISDIEGTSLTVSKDWDIREEDLEEYRKHDTERMKVRPITKMVEKHFIWQDDGIWYSIPYYRGNGAFEGFSYSEIPRDDIKILLSSLKYHKDIQNIEYKSRDYDKSLEIYGNKDLETAREILGFAPKFPLNLPGGFVPVSSLIRPFSETLHDNKLVEMIKMETMFELKDNDSVQNLHLYQTKDTSNYDDMVQNGYIIGNSYSENPEDNKIGIASIMIDGIKVLKYELDITNPNIIAQGITKSQYYTWKQDDIVYTVSFIGDMGNQEEVVKALINTP